jgi:hypothetical protein
MTISQEEGACLERRALRPREALEQYGEQPRDAPCEVRRRNLASRHGRDPYEQRQ